MGITRSESDTNVHFWWSRNYSTLRVPGDSVPPVAVVLYSPTFEMSRLRSGRSSRKERGE